MKRALLFAALTAALATPVSAQTVSGAVMAHFNQDIDSVADLRMVGGGDANLTISARGRSALDYALTIFNSDADSVSARRGDLGTTVYIEAEPSDAFARIRAEGQENE
ncbi:MAG: hypothetical protein AAF376_17905 [Pseudomonadota bacterium]